MDELLRNLGINIDYYYVLATSGLIFARLITAIFLAPFLGGKAVPSRVKIGTGVALLIVMYAPIEDNLPAKVPLQVLPYVALLVKEALVGLTIGFIISLIFHAMDSAGRYLDVARGVGMASLLAPETGTQVSILGQLYFQVTIVIFFILGGHRLFLQAVFDSFQFIPLVSFPDIGSMDSKSIEWLIIFSGNMFSIMLKIIAPPMISIFLTDIIMGIVNRVSPQVNVFMLSQPIKMMVATLMIFIVFSFMIDQLTMYLYETQKALDTYMNLSQMH